MYTESVIFQLIKLGVPFSTANDTFLAFINATKEYMSIKT